MATQKSPAGGSPAGKDEGRRWKAAQEWFVLIAAVVAGVFAYINS